MNKYGIIIVLIIFICSTSIIKRLMAGDPQSLLSDVDQIEIYLIEEYPEIFDRD